MIFVVQTHTNEAFVFHEDQRVASGTPRTASRTIIGQFLDTAAGINYSGDVAKAINFIGRRPGYGSSVPVTVALSQRSYPMLRVPRL